MPPKITPVSLCAGLDLKLVDLLLCQENKSVNNEGVAIIWPTPLGTIHLFDRRPGTISAFRKLDELARLKHDLVEARNHVSRLRSINEGAYNDMVNSINEKEAPIRAATNEAKRVIACPAEVSLRENGNCTIILGTSGQAVSTEVVRWHQFQYSVSMLLPPRIGTTAGCWPGFIREFIRTEKNQIHHGILTSTGAIRQLVLTEFQADGVIILTRLSDEVETKKVVADGGNWIEIKDGENPVGRAPSGEGFNQMIFPAVNGQKESGSPVIRPVG